MAVSFTTRVTDSDLTPPPTPAELVESSRRPYPSVFALATLDEITLAALAAADRPDTALEREEEILILRPLA